uniref:Uncharacterized protein n=1 Tax=Oryza punctata TaxID=4537 RepID=A0A0E0LM96_ORYPU
MTTEQQKQNPVIAKPVAGPTRRLRKSTFEANSDYKDRKEGTCTRAEGTVFLEKPLITRLLQRDGEYYISKDIMDRAMAKATVIRYLKHDMVILMPQYYEF